MKDIEDIAKEKYPVQLQDFEFHDGTKNTVDVNRKLRAAFISGSQYGKEWISVEDKSRPMPAETDFLILFETGEVMRYAEEDLPAEIITHWMPFPEPPKS